MLKKKYFGILFIFLAVSFLLLSFFKSPSVKASGTKVLITGDATQSSITLDSDKIYSITGNLNITGNIIGTNTGVIFVSGDLNITNDYCYGATNCTTAEPAANTGTVFVVKGNVNIDTSVKRVDAVIISSGIICTASTTNICPTEKVQTISSLTVNGSLISLNQTYPIQFMRKLGDNTTAAEVINYQPKYLVILRDLFSDTFQKWSEIDASTSTPTNSFDCNNYSGAGDEKSKLCTLSGCKRCTNALETCMPSGGSCPL